MNKILTFNEKVGYFMYPYMFELEAALREKSEELKSIKFHADEANTDRELKEYIKNFIELSFDKLPNINKAFKLNLINTKKSSISFKYEYFSDIYISKVYLPNEISDDIKNLLKKKNAVYTDPDLLLEITNGQEIDYIRIELKSTKNNSIPGSSIQQVTPTEWVIFVKHTKEKISITTGQYIFAINSTMQFPDRSPRPQVAFNELEKWNEKYRNFIKDSTGEEILNVSISEDLYQKKVEILKDWQGILVDRWLDVIEQKKIKKKEPWFNNTIRRYTRQFISIYEELNQREKDKLKNTLDSAISQYQKNNNEF